MRKEIVKTQLETIRDVMLSASDRENWLTLHEIAEMTGFGEAGISAQLRHLRKPEFSGFYLAKRRRYGETGTKVNRRSKENGERTLGMGQRPWEYRLTREPL